MLVFTLLYNGQIVEQTTNLMKLLDYLTHEEKDAVVDYFDKMSQEDEEDNYVGTVRLTDYEKIDCWRV